MAEGFALSPKKYVCDTCETIFDVPKHCGRSMVLDTEDMRFVCWKGEHQPCCGRESTETVDKCCDTQILKVPGSEDQQILL